MGYKLKITEHAQELLNQLIYHLIYNLKNDQAAKHLLNEIEKIFDRLEENPEQFPKCRDKYLEEKGYREAIVQHMNYLVIFNIEDDKINIVGIFHQLENYQDKIS